MIWLSLCTKFHLSTLTINQQSCFVQSSSVTQVELKKFVLIEFVYLEILFIAKIVIFTWYFKGGTNSWAFLLKILGKVLLMNNLDVFTLFLNQNMNYL